MKDPLCGMWMGSSVASLDNHALICSKKMELTGYELPRVKILVAMAKTSGYSRIWEYFSIQNFFFYLKPV